MKLISLLALFFFLFINNLYSKEINFSGLQKLNINDLQMLSSIDLSKGDYNLDEVNSIIQELYNSDLISDINLQILRKFLLIKVIEAKIIENIYINGNIKFKDEDF
jgi:outer membrane protein assembly factor BamA